MKVIFSLVGFSLIIFISILCFCEKNAHIHAYTRTYIRACTHTHSYIFFITTLLIDHPSSNWPASTCEMRGKYLLIWCTSTHPECITRQPNSTRRWIIGLIHLHVFSLACKAISRVINSREIIVFFIVYRSV